MGSAKNEKHRKTSFKRRRDGEDDTEDILAKKLATHGEKFMQLFEPTRSDTPKTNQLSNKQDKYSSEEEEPISDDDTNSTSSSDDDSDIPPPSDDDKEKDIVEYIFNTKKNATLKTKSAQNQTSIRHTAKDSSAHYGGGNGGDDGDDERARLAEKCFMSHKASRIIDGTSSLHLFGKKKTSQSQDREMTREEFEKLKGEINLFGATALDKKSKSRFTSEMLQKLGAQAQKGPKMSAKIGHGIAKKRARRESDALEEAIATGMVKKKGMGKKKREEKRLSLDKGLVEDGGAFSGGMLRVKRSSFSSKSKNIDGRKSGDIGRGSGKGGRVKGKKKSPFGKKRS